MSKQRDPAKERFWRQTLEQFHASGLSVARSVQKLWTVQNGKRKRRRPRDSTQEWAREWAAESASDGPGTILGAPRTRPMAALHRIERGITPLGGRSA